MVYFIVEKSEWARVLDNELVSVALRNDLDAVRELLRCGADPDSRAEWDGIKAVDRANERGYCAVATLLEEMGATPEIPVEELRKGFKWKEPKFEDG